MQANTGPPESVGNRHQNRTGRHPVSKMKIVKTPVHCLALICAAVSVTSLGLGAAFSITHGSDIAIFGMLGFIFYGLIATTLSPKI
jgi:hypothetical protein